MIRATSERPESGNDAELDFLIIGSGFGGSVAALRLAEKGWRVGVVEKGRRWSSRDLPASSWNVRRYLWAPRLGLRGIQEITLLRDVMVLHGAGVGGGSLVYGNVLFEPGDDWYRAPGWPRGRDWKKTLAPHFATARRMLGVVENTVLSETDERLREASAEMGRAHTFHTNPIGVYFGDGPGVTKDDPYFDGEGPARSGCVLCGGCMVGCRFNAKNTLDKNYLYLAERRGATIVPESRAVDIRPARGGYDVTVEPTGPGRSPGRRVLHARQVVLAAGVLGTVELLLRCKERGSLPELPGALGHQVRTNGEALLGVKADAKDADLSRGTAIQSGVWADEVTHVEAVRYPRGSDLLGLFATMLSPGGNVWTRWLRWTAMVARRPITFVGFFNPLGWARRSMILLVMQAVDSRLDLALRRRWYWPFRRLLDSAGGIDRPPSWVASADELARRLARRIPGVPANLLPTILFDVSATAHILGGCVIGEDSETGVVDDCCRVFGHPGLHVVDGSVIPANLGTNPSLTIAAIAEHAMSQIPAPTARAEG